ncbi:MAG: hypothetical protein JWP37_2265 [Mucilaginibacter sp.]|nr:hypothetical protein [Mucilaginibacter sp.]
MVCEAKTVEVVYMTRLIREGYIISKLANNNSISNYYYKLPVKQLLIFYQIIYRFN